MSRAGDVVATWADADGVDLEPLVVMEPLTAFLDASGLGHGPLTVTPIGDGHSNLTFRLDRAADRFVLRRPPRGPLPRSAHDVWREASVQQRLRAQGVRVPEVHVLCDDRHVLGAPF